MFNSVPVLISESSVAIVPAIGGYGVQVEDIYHLGEFSPHLLVLESGRYLRYISRVGRTRVALSLLPLRALRQEVGRPRAPGVNPT